MLATDNPTIEYELSPNDALEFFSFFIREKNPIYRKRLRRRKARYGVYLISSAIGILVTTIYKPSISALFYPLFVISLVGTFMLWLASRKSAIRKKIEKHMAVSGHVATTGRTRIELHQENVYGWNEDPAKSLDIPWSAIKFVSKTDDYIFLYTAEGAGVFIPRRAFNSAIEFDQFHDLAMRFWHQNDQVGASGARRESY